MQKVIFFIANLCENVTRYKDFNQKFDAFLNFSFNIWYFVVFFKETDSF